MSTCGNIGAIYRRELAGTFNSPIAYVFIALFLALAGILTFGLGTFFENNQADLRPFFYNFPLLFLVLVPAMAMRLWAEERRSGTVELLFTLGVSPMQAIWAKFLAGWTFLVLAIALTFPVVVTTLYLGDPDVGVIVTGYFACVLLAGAYLSVGLFTSALTRNQVISYVLSAVLGLLLLLAGHDRMIALLKRWIPDSWVDGVAAVSFLDHFETMQRGLVDLRDVVYFVSVMGIMLFATWTVLRRQSSR